MLKNYSNTNEEAPIYGELKISNIVYILLFAGLPIYLFRQSFSYGNSIIATILYLILAIVTAIAGFAFSEWKRDGRKILQYFKDYLKTRQTHEIDNFKKIKKFDIQEVIENLKK